MAISYAEAGRILRRDFLADPYTRETSWKVELYQADDHPSADGSNAGTLVGNGHTAKTVAVNGTNFTVTGLTATNAGVITGDNNGTGTVTATGFAIRRASDNGLVWSGPLVGPIVLTSGAPFSIPIGAIDIAFTGGITDAWGNDWLDHIITGAAITHPTTDVELDAVTTAPSASAAGTVIAYTGYAPVAIPINGTYWQVNNNVLSLQPNLAPAFPVMQTLPTGPRGVNIYRDTTAGMRMYFQDYGSTIPVLINSQLTFDSNTDANSILITVT
jgi:hypothetical protein